jgi:hypothetical protein
MNAFLTFAQHFEADHQGILSLLAIAAILNMPRPRTSTLYKWLYGTLQSFMGAIRPNEHPQNPQPPAEPAKQ